jgi:hypothetical protein
MGRRTAAGRPSGTNRGAGLLTDTPVSDRLCGRVGHPFVSYLDRFASDFNRLCGRLRRPGDDRLFRVVTSSMSRCVLTVCGSGVSPLSPLAPLASTFSMSVDDAGR